MTTLVNRAKTALVVIDVQSGVVDDAFDRNRIVGNVAALVERARAAGTPVVWVQHSSQYMPRDSEGWRYVPELEQLEGEPVVHKTYGDSFEATDLESVLVAVGAGHLVVAGAQTDACIRSTIHGAFTRGYDVTLVGDAHTTEDLSEWGAPSPDLVIKHTNLYWADQGAPGREAKVVDTAQVAFGA